MEEKEQKQKPVATQSGVTKETPPSEEQVLDMAFKSADKKRIAILDVVPKWKETGFRQSKQILEIKMPNGSPFEVPINDGEKAILKQLRAGGITLKADVFLGTNPDGSEWYLVVIPMPDIETYAKRLFLNGARLVAFKMAMGKLKAGAK